VRKLHTSKDEKLHGGCSSATVQEISRNDMEVEFRANQLSQLRHWPVQLTLVPATTSFLKSADSCCDRLHGVCLCLFSSGFSEK